MLRVRQLPLPVFSLRLFDYPKPKYDYASFTSYVLFSSVSFTPNSLRSVVEGITRSEKRKPKSELIRISLIMARINEACELPAHSLTAGAAAAGSASAVGTIVRC